MMQKHLKRVGYYFLAMAMLGVSADIARDTFNGEMKWLALSLLMLVISAVWGGLSSMTRLTQRNTHDH